MLTVSNCTISNNESILGGCAGGIRNYGTLNLTDSTISFNSEMFIGGGVLNTGTLTVMESTINGNTALADGGGIENDGTLTVVNSTVYGNGAGNGESGNGAGIDNEQTLTLVNSTLSDNFVENSGPVGGISLSAGTATLKNTILANKGLSGNCSLSGTAKLVSDGHNLSDDTTCSTLLTDPTDLNNTPAGLDPGGIKNNSGPTETIALLSGAGVDYIPTSPTDFCTLAEGVTALTTGQRGMPRPDPEDGASGSCDIGAFELQATVTPTPTATHPNPDNDCPRHHSDGDRNCHRNRHRHEHSDRYANCHAHADGSYQNHADSSGLRPRRRLELDADSVIQDLEHGEEHDAGRHCRKSFGPQ